MISFYVKYPGHWNIKKIMIDKNMKVADLHGKICSNISQCITSFWILYKETPIKRTQEHLKNSTFQNGGKIHIKIDKLKIMPITNIYKKDNILCIICLEKKKDKCVLPCGHIYHENCISKWLNKNPTCPICRNKYIIVTEKIS